MHDLPWVLFQPDREFPHAIPVLQTGVGLSRWWQMVQHTVVICGVWPDQGEGHWLLK